MSEEICNEQLDEHRIGPSERLLGTLKLSMCCHDKAKPILPEVSVQSLASDQQLVPTQGLPLRQHGARPADATTDSLLHPEWKRQGRICFVQQDILCEIAMRSALPALLNMA